MDRRTQEGATVPETPEVHPEHRMLIDGELVEAASGRTFDNANPATEEILGQVADGSAEDMQRAIAAARRAFDDDGLGRRTGRSVSAASSSCTPPWRPSRRRCGNS